MYIPLAIKTALLMNFLPLTAIVLTQILSYRAIKKSADQFNFDAVRIRKMKKVRKTFIRVVIVFFTLVTPASTCLIIFNYLYKFHVYFLLRHRDLITTLVKYFNLLVAVNSIVNPFIYAKIQRRFRPCRCFSQCLQYLQNIRQSDVDRGGFENHQGQDGIELQQMQKPSTKSTSKSEL